ncbi:MAG: DUF1385 domain-containing protein, partial [Oscillospiraceae bacterium]
MPKQCKTSIGGQALIEGVMMKGPFKTAMAVRLPSGEIDTEEWETAKPNAFYKKIPFVRGIFNFIDMLALGYKCLMKSAEKQGIEEEPTKFEKYLEEKLGDNITKLFEAIVVVFGFGLAILLFTMFPAIIVGLFKSNVSSPIVLTAIEGVLKIVILVTYLWAVSKMEDIKRTFEYHGAEHKTIFCFEHGKELTVENVKEQLRFHPRCGTSFLLIVLVISIILFSFITWESIWIRIGLKILLLPLVVGIGYELIKIAGRYDNVFTRLISKPGLWLQHLTTREPDDKQIEVAIEAFKRVIPE